MNIVLPILIMVGLGLVYWWATVRDKQRQEKLLELARSLGLQISWELDPKDKDRFARFDVSQMGHRQVTKTVLCADTGETRMVVFDFEYSKGTGKRRIDRNFMMALCTDIRIRGPKLAVQPESWGTMLASLVGGHDIDFEDDPAYSSAFHLVGSDKERVREFMNATRRRSLLAYPQMRLQVDGDCLLIMQPHFRLDADNLRQYMSEALAATRIMIDE